MLEELVTKARIIVKTAVSKEVRHAWTDYIDRIKACKDVYKLESNKVKKEAKAKIKALRKECKANMIDACKEFDNTIKGVMQQIIEKEEEKYTVVEKQKTRKTLSKRHVNA